MVKMFYDADCNLSLLDGKTVAIIGFGSQGHVFTDSVPAVFCDTFCHKTAETPDAVRTGD